ncbi:MAG: UDP-N-acetylmuramoyl-L-alanine--D-glutamate ligase, partial [Pseudomonadota bacterium]
MIIVPGFEGQRVAILGLGRSGLSAARALREGGAIPLCWDDTEAARTRAEDEGFTLHRADRAEAYSDIARLIVSPGIPHLYPAPHPSVQAAMQAGVPVDNDIGL